MLGKSLAATVRSLGELAAVVVERGIGAAVLRHLCAELSCTDVTSLRRMGNIRAATITELWDGWVLGGDHTERRNVTLDALDRGYRGFVLR